MTSRFTVTHVGKTLQQASAELAEEFDLGDGLTFEQTVTGLWEVNKRLGLVKARSAALSKFVAEYYRCGYRRYGDVVVRQVLPDPSKPPKISRTVSKDVIKEYSPELYEQARVLKPRMEAKNERKQSPTVDGLPVIPGLPTRNSPLDRLLDAKHTIAELRRKLGIEQGPIKSRLAEIARLIDWNGETLIFDLGWEIKTVAPIYCPYELRRQAPTVYARLEHEVIVPAKPKVILTYYEADPEDETDEPFGE